MTHDPLYTFFLRWSARLPLDQHEAFRADVVVLVTYEQTRERRRLCGDVEAYRVAREETEREAAALKGRRA